MYKPPKKVPKNEIEQDDIFMLSQDIKNKEKLKQLKNYEAW